MTNGSLKRSPAAFTIATWCWAAAPASGCAGQDDVGMDDAGVTALGGDAASVADSFFDSGDGPDPSDPDAQPNATGWSGESSSSGAAQTQASDTSTTGDEPDDTTDTDTTGTTAQGDSTGSSGAATTGTAAPPDDPTVCCEDVSDEEQCGAAFGCVWDAANGELCRSDCLGVSQKACLTLAHCGLQGGDELCAPLDSSVCRPD